MTCSEGPSQRAPTRSGRRLRSRSRTITTCTRMVAADAAANPPSKALGSTAASQAVARDRGRRHPTKARDDGRPLGTQRIVYRSWLDHNPLPGPLIPACVAVDPDRPRLQILRKARENRLAYDRPLGPVNGLFTHAVQLALPGLCRCILEIPFLCAFSPHPGRTGARGIAGSHAEAGRERRAWILAEAPRPQEDRSDAERHGGDDQGRCASRPTAVGGGQGRGGHGQRDEARDGLRGLLVARLDGALGDRE
jgi:hypothetical protein